ncbi:MAG TPA: DNA adenine methylase, partial [Treponemataceae bacterium]|nr:DNA adenine methylase [Treponemataceae bacterium]
MKTQTVNSKTHTNHALQTESNDYLEKQLITYIGNKRALLSFIGEAVHFVKEKLEKEKLIFFDVFSGSGIVSRYFRQYAQELYTNDLEDYAKIINKCYLSNSEDRDIGYLQSTYTDLVKHTTDAENNNSWKKGIISKLYAPKDDKNIQKDERVFYTTHNASYIDTSRAYISKIPIEAQPFFLAPLLSQASIHANTAGVFKGFYKNKDTGIGEFGGKNRDALTRIRGNISIPFPVFSNFDCPVHIVQGDANSIVKNIPLVDIAYLDPPYNQHPYGSNYFMLNIIANKHMPKNISKISGIPNDWNRSAYNYKTTSLHAFSELIAHVQARFLLVSFNSEGFISMAKMTELLECHGKVTIMQ